MDKVFYSHNLTNQRMRKVECGIFHEGLFRPLELRGRDLVFRVLVGRAGQQLASACFTVEWAPRTSEAIFHENQFPRF